MRTADGVRRTAEGDKNKRVHRLRPDVPGEHKGEKAKKILRDLYAKDPNTSLEAATVAVGFQKPGHVRRLLQELGIKVPNETPSAGGTPPSAKDPADPPELLDAAPPAEKRKVPVVEGPTHRANQAQEDTAANAVWTEVLSKTKDRTVADLRESIVVGDAVRKLWGDVARSTHATALSFFEEAGKFFVNEHGRYTERLATIYLLQQQVEDLERELDPIERRRGARQEVMDLAVMFHMAGQPFTTDELLALLRVAREDGIEVAVVQPALPPGGEPT